MSKKQQSVSTAPGVAAEREHEGTDSDVKRKGGHRKGGRCSLGTEEKRGTVFTGYLRSL